MHYSGSVYRPPSEAHSLIIQVTVGCSHNKCAFCNMYKDKKFSITPMEQVRDDLRWAREQYSRVERFFLADGDALILPTAQLLEILGDIRSLFPECSRVSTYASPKSILGKTPEDLSALHAAGLDFAYLGLETGNDPLLKKINKGVTVAQQIEAGQKLKAAGLTLSVTAINGLAGSNGDWQAHAVDTAAALNAMHPDFIALLTLRVYTGTPMAEWIASGELVQPTPMELIRETKLFLEHIDCPGAVFRSNHASNYLVLAGTLNQDRERLLHECDEALRGDAPLRRFVELGR
ncbi:radical SAM protein [Oscillibacter valericigenes]|uniref:radical SAM protein n=1 Tax=Oscillibacter ruminantium TaxID=1263547 RepID=UPI00030B000F|nr:radical SAM protein [Oscillibacter ruminantium]MDN0031933.1 radical SAM protein [Oscillibacter valericigenes]MEA5041450.1 radical SAM protein [Oscillibacter ruminantium]